MRHITAQLDLEHPTMIALRSALDSVKRQKLVADLSAVDVLALGADGAGKSVTYWDSLQEFWREYFRRAGASLKKLFGLARSPDESPVAVAHKGA